MVWNLLSWCISTLFVFSISYLVFRAFKTSNRPHNALAFLFITVYITTLYTLLLGLLGLLNAHLIGFISFFGLVLLFIVIPSRREMLHARGDGIGLMRSIHQGWLNLPRWIRWLTFVVGLAYLVRMAFLIWALPPFVWDSLTYHLTNVAEWTQRGRIMLVDTPINRVALPANFEVFSVWFTVFLHHDVVIEIAGIPAYVIACLATYALARNIDLSISAAWMATLAYGSTPALILATTGTKNDPLMAGLFLMAVSIMVDLRQQWKLNLDRNILGRFVLLVMCLMFAFGTKIYILQLLGGLVFIGILIPISSGKVRFWLNLPRRVYSEFRNIDFKIRVILMLSVIGSVFLGGYWHIRNWITFGNPFYPYGVKLGSTALFKTPGNVYLYPGFERLFENLISFANKFGDRQFVIIPALMNTTGWGWFTYVLGLPSLLWAFIRRPKIRVLCLGFFIPVLLFFITSRPTPYNMRYLIWLPAVMAIAFAALYEWIPKDFRFKRLAFILLLMACMALNFFMTLNYNRVLLSDFVGILKVPLWERDAAKLHIYVDPEYERVLDVVPQDEILGYNLHHDAFIYPLYRADFSQRLAYVPFSSNDSCDELVEAIQLQGTRWLFAIPERTLPENLVLVQKCTEGGYLVSIERGIYALKNE